MKIINFIIFISVLVLFGGCLFNEVEILVMGLGKGSSK